MSGMSHRSSLGSLASISAELPVSPSGTIFRKTFLM